ncbi:1,2-phenylacetyl-CoA epoxidase subunit PaaC [Haloechinothrix salitolerans]|uniref:1,2-phenylacetyl-CoA epoxidase subunit PaaC n=1 Tax=Haloechinothrix salitolerans TaxID=926830 RepID=A0ABW2BT24_9PSEU
MSFDNAYEAVSEANDQARWAFGTGFTDPLSGVDTSLPSGVDGNDLASYCLMLGDDALIMSHRLQQWCTRAPELEDEVALANIGLDLLGQARLLLTRAGKAGTAMPASAGAAVADRPEDALAFFRDEHEFRNIRLAELSSHEPVDFALVIAQLLVFATWRLALLRRLTDSRDPVLAAIAAKGVKEVTYHRDYAAQWTVRLGDGTDYSHRRMQSGLDAVWPYVGELFDTHPVERALADVAVDPAMSRTEFDDVLTQVCSAATLTVPDIPPLAGVSGRKGRDGVHTEEMGFLLAEMQAVARAHPEATW